MSPQPASQPAGGWRLRASSPRSGAAAICLLLAIVHTWPLATAPATLSRNDNGDAQLNEWILCWVAHQLPRAPAQLFQANIFHPSPDVLAFSEPLIVPAMIGAPLRWLGASPVLVFNVVLILGFALTAFAAYTLVRHWTGDHAAGLLAGSMFAFNTHTLTRLPHIQAVHAWGLPLALLSSDRLIVSGRLRDAMWLAVWMTALAYTSGYLAVFATVMVGIALVARAPEWWRRAPAVLSRFAVAAGISAIAVLPVLLPYRRVAREEGMVRSLDTVAMYSASLKGYLVSAGRLHYSLWSATFFKEPLDSFFPGFIVLILAAIALAWTMRGRAMQSQDVARFTRRRVVMLSAIAAAGVVLSLGPQTPIYGWMFAVFPPMQGLRAAARFANLFLLAIAILAGIGVVVIRRRLPMAAAAPVVVALVIGANVESLRAPFPFTRFEGIPTIYSEVARQPGPVVLVEVPFYAPEAVFENATYVLNSTAHFRPLMNGYSGYTPESYVRYAANFRRFPEPHAIDAMRRAGATHVMVHPQRFPREPDEIAVLMQQVNSSPLLERVAIGQRGISLYKLK